MFEGRKLEFFCDLTPEDRGRFRIASAKRTALDIHPKWYSPKEAEEVISNFNNMLGDFIMNYEVDDIRMWEVSAISGKIYYMDGS